MKKILCLIDRLGLDGGAERQMAGLAGMLHEHGYNVCLATYHKHDYNEILKENYGIESVHIKSGSNALSKLWAVRKFIKNGKFDIVIAYKDGATIIASLIKLFGLNSKLIVSERNTTTKLTLRERIKFFLYRQADAIVPNSYSQGKFIGQNYPNLACKVNVITNFTDINEFSPTENDPNHECTHILVTARIAPQKNVIRFLNVVSKIKAQKLPIKITWYGDLNKLKNYGDEVRRRYAELQISDILEFKQTTKNIVDAYRNCDIFCLPSLHEGYPNVVCEAMCCGKPVLCSDVCDNAFIVENNLNGWLFNPFDEDNMLTSIKKACSINREKLLTIGANNRTTAIAKFSAHTFVQKYINLIEKL